MMTDLLPVPFRDATLYLADEDGEPYVPMRPIVEAMGLTWQSQHVKIMQRFRSTVTEIVTVAEDGRRREMLCLPLHKLPAWLYTISPNKIPDPEVQEKVLAYQAECDDVLWKHWTETHPPAEDRPADVPEFLPPPEDPIAKAIDSRAWELARDSYEDFRKWMGKLRESGEDFDPRYWKPRWSHVEAVKTIEMSAYTMEAMAKTLHEDARQLALALDVEPYDRRKPDPEEGSVQAIAESIERLAAAQRRESPSPQ